MHEVLELERDVMKLHVRTGEEVHGVMIRIATHEAEEIANPVGDAKAQHPLVECHGALDVGCEEGDMSQLERPDTGDLRVLGEIAPFLEQLDRRSLVVLERQHLAHAGDGIVAQLAAHAVLGQLPRQLAEVGIGRDFERQFDAVRSICLVELDHQLPDLGGEKGAVLVALGRDQPHEFPVIRDGLFQVRRLEGGVADASRFDHGVISISLSGATPRPKAMYDYSAIRSGALSAAKPWKHSGLTRDNGFSLELDPSYTAACHHLRTRQNRDIRRKLARAASHAREQTNMAGYKLATYQTSDGPRAGLVVDDKVFDAAKLTGKGAYATVLGILEDWRTAQGVLRKAAAAAGKSRLKASPLGRTKLLAPVRWPSAIYCAGANYADHAAEMARRMNRPLEPDPHTQGLKAWHFMKAPRALADPGATVKISGVSDRVDWEVELAAVIGKPAKNVPEEKALDYVAGYTAANDLSARDRGPRPNISDTSPFKADWTKHKSFDGSCPMGPWIVPASDIGDPQNLGLKLWVNDVLRQDSNSKDMIFNLAEQIAQLSNGMTLHPGDLILTGTPAGVGSARGEFLKAGDVVKIWIEKIGTLTNKIA